MKTEQETMRGVFRDTLLCIFGLFVLIVVACTFGCQKEHVENQHSDGGKVTKISGTSFGLQCRIIEFTMDNATHEYLDYDRGICHYPECKYCKRKRNEKE